jgi:hypothetical protein
MERWRLALGAMVILACAPPARAEEPSVEPVEPFREICDQAMAELAVGNGRGLDVFDRVVAPERFSALSDLKTHIRRHYEVHSSDWGEPIGWEYLGSKRVGDFFTQFLYAVRYDKGPVVWRFLAVQRDGSWSLSGCQFDGDCESALAGAGWSRTDEDNARTQLTAAIVSRIAENSREGFELLLRHFTIRNAQAELANERLAAIYADSTRTAGKAVHCELVAARSAGGVLAQHRYLIQFESGHTFLDLVLYRPDQEWKVIGCVFKGDQDVLGAAPLDDGGQSVAAKPADAATAGRDPDTRHR